MSRSTMAQLFARLPINLRYVLSELLISAYNFDARILKDYIDGKFATTFNYSNESIAKIKALHDRHKGERCFILGNGPSLNRTNLTNLRNEVSIASSGIFHIFKENSYRPTYYTVVDFIFAQQYARIIDKVIKNDNITGILLNSLKKYIQGDPSTIWVNFLPTWIHGHYSQYTQENMETNREKPLLPEFSENLVRGIHDAGTVTYVNLQLALYMGFSDIYLIGVDHNYKVKETIVTENPDILISDYEVDPNHFSPNYTPKGHKMAVPRVTIMESAYYKARKVAESRGVNIYDATKGGQLKVYRKIDYDSLF
ncbi:MAG: 6-hydroxymethylpterin diphosphokinase MptE-like protein [Promethearchaeota archaeon]